jgi:MFS family permease
VIRRPAARREPPGGKPGSSDFTKLWIGQAVSSTGSAMGAAGIPVLAYQMTGSTLALSLTAVALFLPYPTIGLLLGAVADRYDRRRTIVLADTARALASFSVPLLFMLGLLTAPFLYLSVFVGAALLILSDASQFGAVPRLVPADQLVAANSRLRAAISGGRVIGIALGSALVAVWPVHYLLVIDAATYLASAAAALLIRRDLGPTRVPGRAALWREVAGDAMVGLRVVLAHRTLRSISTLTAIVNLLRATVLAQIVAFAIAAFDSTETEILQIYAAGAVGVVLTMAVGRRVTRRLPPGRVLALVFVIDGLAVTAFAWTTWYPLALFLWAVGLGVGALFMVVADAYRQLVVPDEQLGRVVTVASVMAWSGIPVGAYLGGWVIELTGNIRATYGAIGILIVGVALAYRASAMAEARWDDPPIAWHPVRTGAEEQP